MLVDDLTFRGDQQDLHLPVARVLVEDLEIEADVLELEGDVIRRLHLQKEPNLLVLHLVHQQPLDDDRAAGDGAHAVGLVDPGLEEGLLDALEEQVPVHDLAFNDRLGRQLDNSVFGETRLPLRVIDLDNLDKA